MSDYTTVFHPAARLDVIEIGSHSLETWGERQMERYVDGLHACIDGLRRFPLRGKPAVGLGGGFLGVEDGFRTIRYGAHVIIYYVIDDEIVVARVLHERQDPVRHLPRK